MTSSNARRASNDHCVVMKTETTSALAEPGLNNEAASTPSDITLGGGARHIVVGV